MSAVTSARKQPAAMDEQSLKGRWGLTVKHSVLGGLVNSFEVTYQIPTVNDESVFFGSVNTTKGTDLALQDGQTRPLLNATRTGVVVSFEITYDGIVYRFWDGVISPENPFVIVDGIISIERSGAEDGSWSAQAVGIPPIE